MTYPWLLKLDHQDEVDPWQIFGQRVGVAGCSICWPFHATTLPIRPCIHGTIESTTDTACIIFESLCSCIKMSTTSLPSRFKQTDSSLMHFIIITSIKRFAATMARPTMLILVVNLIVERKLYREIQIQLVRSIIGLKHRLGVALHWTNQLVNEQTGTETI